MYIEKGFHKDKKIKKGRGRAADYRARQGPPPHTVSVDTLRQPLHQFASGQFIRIQTPEFQGVTEPADGSRETV